MMALVFPSPQRRRSLDTHQRDEMEKECEEYKDPTDGRLLSQRKITMTLLDYIFCFLAGALLANAVPHFVHGISGDRFPTPFANPPGKGTLNVAWSLFNLVLGYILFRLGPDSCRGAYTHLASVTGASEICIAV